MSTKEYPVCKHCGSAEISVDATARWSIEEQKWELTGTCDNYCCDECNGEANIDWRDVYPVESSDDPEC